MKQNRFSPIPVGIAILTVLGAASPAPAQTLTLVTNLATGNGPALAIPVDVNNTGHMGVVCANYGFRFGGAFGLGGGTGTALSVFTNDGRGNLLLSQTPTVGLEPVGVAAADIN